MHSYFVLGLASAPDNGELIGDDASAAALERLLQLADKGFAAAFGRTPRGILVSVSPYGPMFAFLDPDITRTKSLMLTIGELAVSSGQTLKAALAWGPLREAELGGGGNPNFEGEPAIRVARLIARLDADSAAIDESAMSYWIPQSQMAAGDREWFNGKHADEKYQATILRGVFKTVAAPAGRKAVAASEARARIPTKGARFLRRRSRVVPPGSQELRELIGKLLSERTDAGERVKYVDQIRRLGDALSGMIARAAYCESIGNIEQMLVELDRRRFAGLDECYRRLFRAVALDKLDQCERALDDLTFVLLQAPFDSELIRAAQLNAAVCAEKLDRFDEVNAERFLVDRAFAFSSGEKLWTKALSLQLVVCTRTGRPFAGADLVAAALAEEYANAPKGFVKTLLNWHGYTGEPLSDENVAKVLELERHMSLTARAGILGQLLAVLPAGPQADDVVRLLEQLAKDSGSYAVKKWVPQPPTG